MASLLGSGQKNIQDLPENLLLEIFTYLPTKELCTAGRVCRTWRRVVNDNSLWRHVDLSPYKMNLHKMWKVIRAHFSAALISLHLRGYMDKAVVNWKKSSISDAMLRELRDRCPNIRRLGLVMTSLSGVSMRSLPPGLTHLSVTSSFIPPGWFRDAHAHLPALTHLSLAESTKTASPDIRDIAAWTGLRMLNIAGCYRVKEDGLVTLAGGCKVMEELDISGSGVTDAAVHKLARGMPGLRRLGLAGCHGITDGSLATIAACLPALERIDVSGCKKITEEGISKLSAKSVISDAKK